jgi:hypothetical protein
MHPSGEKISHEIFPTRNVAKFKFFPWPLSFDTASQIKLLKFALRNQKSKLAKNFAKKRLNFVELTISRENTQIFSKKESRSSLNDKQKNKTLTYFF